MDNSACHSPVPCHNPAKLPSGNEENTYTKARLPSNGWPTGTVDAGLELGGPAVALPKSSENYKGNTKNTLPILARYPSDTLRIPFGYPPQNGGEEGSHYFFTGSRKGLFGHVARVGGDGRIAP